MKSKIIDALKKVLGNAGGYLRPELQPVPVRNNPFGKR